MFTKFNIALVTLAVLSAAENVSARYQWLERDNRAVRITGRRFGQEHPAVIDKLSAACPGQICGNLAGQAITPLLAAQPECSQQDMADAIIDAALTQDEATKANMIQLAIEYRQAEKNTPPDFSVQPPANRNSVFCQKAPRHAELNNLVQAQDPANDPELFFDPATKQTVKLGSQANTKPFVVGNGSSASNSTGSDTSSSAAASATASVSSAVSASSAASSQVLVATSAASDDCVVTVTVTADATATASAAATTSAAASTSTGASNIGNFGSCSVPQIEFGVGFDNRKETSFQPVDKASFNHGSAQAIGIISQFICDQLTNSCKADQTAKDTCKQAQAAGNAAPAKTGAAADAFNAVFGITTNFAAVQAIDDQGRPVAGTGSGATASANNAAAATTTSAAAASTSAASTGSSTGAGNFGSCSVPQIEFGVGFDNRKETSFQPVDKASFNHGSAQAIGIISQFICDQLTNSCKADQAAKDTCKQAQAAGNAAPAKTGAAADAFNAVFGIKTNFAAVQAIDDQGRPVAGTGSDASGNNNAAGTTAAAATTAAATTAAAAATASASSSTGSSSSAIGDFGKCSVPKIEFGVGFDNRKETSFQPADKASYAHDSAQNGDIITQFMCDNLVNVCGADATAKATCAKAKAAFDTVTAKTGGQADAFNAVFGIKTNFAAVTPLDNQGNPVAAA